MCVSVCACACVCLCLCVRACGWVGEWVRLCISACVCVCVWGGGGMKMCVCDLLMCACACASERALLTCASMHAATLTGLPAVHVRHLRCRTFLLGPACMQGLVEEAIVKEGLVGVGVGAAILGVGLTLLFAGRK